MPRWKRYPYDPRTGKLIPVSSPITSTGAAVAVVEPAPVAVEEQILKYLGLDPRNIETQALVMLCERYRLDPLLGHAGVISTKNGFRPYITRDGMLAIAHRSGQLDGIVVDEERRNSENDGWTAYVSVWRRDMSHPFRYGAQCKDAESQAKQGNGPEMALARAERRALRRAFDIPAYDDSAAPEHVESGDTGSGDIVAAAPARAAAAPDVVTSETGAPPRYLTDEQREELGQLMREIGLHEAVEQLDFASDFLHRKVEAPGRLTYDEGERLIVHLRELGEPM